MASVVVVQELSLKPRRFESRFRSVVQNGFRPPEDGDLIGLHSLTESRLQPLSYAGDLVGDRTERPLLGAPDH